jgi:hypothetical protein
MTFIHACLSPLPLGEGSGEGPQELAHPLTGPHPPPHRRQVKGPALIPPPLMKGGPGGISQAATRSIPPYPPLPKGGTAQHQAP